MTGGVNYDGVEKLPNSTSHTMRGVITGKMIDTGKGQNCKSSSKASSAAVQLETNSDAEAME